MNDSQTAGPSPSQFHFGRVLAVIVPLALAVSGGLVGWGYFDLGQSLARWIEPPLVAVSGQVYLNGAPVAKAEVFTEPVGVKRRGGMGITDGQGRFELRTDVDGDFFPGAYAGEHKVIIHVKDPKAPSGPFRPPLISPPACAEFETTPLRLQVVRDPARNQVEYRLEHQVAASQPQDGGAAKRPMAEPGGIRKPGKFGRKKIDKPSDQPPESSAAKPAEPEPQGTAEVDLPAAPAEK